MSMALVTTQTTAVVHRADITDLQRAEFLQKLSDAARAGDVMLSPFATDFVGSYNRFQRYWQWMTDGRRAKCDELRAEYGAAIEMPLPPDPSAALNRRKIPEAEDGCCQFLVRLDGPQRPCNEPAVFQRANGFRYCQSCADGVVASLKRRGQTIHLIKYP